MASRTRALWRAAREAPLIGTLFLAVDRMWWAHTIRRADIVDGDAVAAQVGRPISAASAVRRYVRGGFRSGFTLNPLFMERTVSRQLSDADRVPALYAYLVNDRSRLDVSPNWDARGLATAEPTSLEDPAGPLGFAWRRGQVEGWVTLGSGSAQRRVAWSDVVAAIATPPATAPPPGLVGALCICVLGPQESDPDHALMFAGAAADELGATVDLVVTGQRFDEFAQAALLRLHAPRVSVRRANLAEVSAPPAEPRNGLTIFRGPDAAVAHPAVSELAKAARDSPAAALWLAPDGTVASAGTFFHDGRSFGLLAGHPAEDARRIGSTIDVPSIDGPARAWPSGASPHGPGRTLTSVTVIAPNPAVPPRSVGGDPRLDTDVSTLLAAAGLVLAGWDAEGPIIERAVSAVQDGTPSLRWAIKTAAPAGLAGESWGDTHFARGIARALERLGQQVAVDPFPARDRPTSRLDDVTLVIRGPHRIVPPSTGRRLLWIISHPDEITIDELHDFDHVFAASPSWARAASARFRRPVEALLQATDADRFHPSGAERTDEIIFVGTARGLARPVVIEPLKAGLPVRVYGPDWTGYIPGSAIAGTNVPNSSLPELYEAAGVVLNDHWPAMSREGFVSNRLFDVVASGGRAISDDVAGIDDLFAGAVRVYRSADELVTMLSGDLGALFPDAEHLAETSEQVRARDSFDARARKLLETALSLPRGSQ